MLHQQFFLIKKFPQSKTFEQHWTVPIYIPAYLQTKDTDKKQNGTKNPKYSEDKKYHNMRNQD